MARTRAQSKNQIPAKESPADSPTSSRTSVLMTRPSPKVTKHRPAPVNTALGSKLKFSVVLDSDSKPEPAVKIEKDNQTPLKSAIRTPSSPPKDGNGTVTFNSALNYNDGTQATVKFPSVASFPALEIGSGTHGSRTEPPTLSSMESTATSTEGGSKTTTLANTKTTETLSHAFGPKSKEKLKHASSATVKDGSREFPAFNDAMLPPSLKSFSLRRSPATPFSSKYQKGDKLWDLITEILEVPRSLTTLEAAAAFVSLQKILRDYCKAQFGYELSSAEMRAWPIHSLADKYPEFARFCTYMADGSQYGWQKLFTSSRSRPQLAYGIISRVIETYVFQHTCFGLSEDEVTMLENQDKEFILFDGFVRTKNRAAMLASILKAKSPKQFADDLSAATKELTTKLVLLLDPLLQYQGMMTEVSMLELSRAIKIAASLSISLRLSGHDGTIYNYVFPNKGSQFEMVVQECVNKRHVVATRHHAQHPRDPLLVKIACFPSVTAYVPHGPDAVELESDPTLIGKPVPGVDGKPEQAGPYVEEVEVCKAEVYLEWTPKYPPVPGSSLAQSIAIAAEDRSKNSSRVKPKPAIKRTGAGIKKYTNRRSARSRFLRTAAPVVVIAATTTAALLFAAANDLLPSSLQKYLPPGKSVCTASQRLARTLYYAKAAVVQKIIRPRTTIEGPLLPSPSSVISTKDVAIVPTPLSPGQFPASSFQLMQRAWQKASLAFRVGGVETQPAVVAATTTPTGSSSMTVPVPAGLVTRWGFGTGWRGRGTVTPTTIGTSSMTVPVPAGLVTRWGFGTGWRGRGTVTTTTPGNGNVGAMLGRS